ncbi:MAG TPA: FtsX-like permease family protein [Bacteroidota bacterium]|nr:FtsX-like permease family protein [Bacteroidota bacterium]
MKHSDIRRSPGGIFLRMAWRNLWRNKKRTVIASASIVFAVLLAVAMSSMATGGHEYMIFSAVRFSTGHLQIHGRGYWEKRSLDESMVYDSALIAAAAQIPSVAEVVPRLESVALISRGNATRVSSIIGIDPLRENAMTALGSRVVRGTPLLHWNAGAIIAEGLARMLDADVGDSIVIYGQGYQGVTAAGILPIAAIVHFPVPDMNNTGVFLSLSTMQSMFAAPDRITSVAILLHRDEDLSAAARAVTALAGPDREVMTWRQMMPELVQAIAADDGGMVIMLLILYVVIGFGIFGTVMMMTAERRHEFGVTIAVGMKRWRLMVITSLEALMVSMLGAVVGILAAVPVIAYFARFPIRLGGEYAAAMLAYGLEPILPVSTDPAVFLLQGLSVFLLGAVSALYPIMVLRSLDPVRAMRR